MLQVVNSQSLQGILGRAFGAAVVSAAVATSASAASLTFDEIQSLSYLEVKGSGLANTCPVLADGTGNKLSLKAGSYKIDSMCLEKTIAYCQRELFKCFGDFQKEMHLSQLQPFGGTNKKTAPFTPNPSLRIGVYVAVLLCPRCRALGLSSDFPVLFCRVHKERGLRSMENFPSYLPFVQSNGLAQSPPLSK